MTPGGQLAAVAASLARQEWIFAKTMPDNPHEYCLRRRWVGDDDAFVEAVEVIREAGYEALFEGRPYTQLDIDDHFYWTMGFPVDETILINRKQIGGRMSNEMHALTVYRHQGAWVYDDTTFGRVAEPLVLGASEILDSIIQADLGYHTREPVGVLFSAQEFPGAHCGEWVRGDSGGNWYALDGEEAWLCPALLDYFDSAPAILWVRARNVDAS